MLRTETNTVEEDAQDARDHGEAAQPLQRLFPQPDEDRYCGVRGQPAVLLRISRVAQYIDHVSALYALGIVNPGIRPRSMGF